MTSQVAQVVAYKLGVPLDMVTVQRTNTITSANSEATGGSVTSEAVCQVWKQKLTLLMGANTPAAERFWQVSENYTHFKSILPKLLVIFVS